MKERWIAGIDYGSDSVRVILVEGERGEKRAEGVARYARWSQGMYCNPETAQYRQHPRDYLEALETAMQQALQMAGEGAGEKVVALAIDTTGSTPCPVDAAGVPLAMTEGLEDEPDAMFHLWKDHTAAREAEEINRVFSQGEVDYTRYQGIYSAEWFWAKILHTTRKNPRIREKAHTWMEHCDWIAGLLAGNTTPETIHHSACAAGHKALWHSSFQGLPSRECLASMDEYLGKVYDRYGCAPDPAGTCIGMVTPEWAKRLGLNIGVTIGMGSFDAHAGGVGAGVKKRTMVKVIGTSTVDLLVEESERLEGKELKAYCGQAEDSIVPGYVGIEAGQAAFGDIFAWFERLLLWPLDAAGIPESILDDATKTALTQYYRAHLLQKLEEGAMQHVEDGETALDWFNGRRYPVLNDTIKAAVTGLSLGTTAPALYCALVKAAVFGSRAIYDQLRNNGIEVDQMIAVGGIAKKSKLIMQMLADVMNLPIMVCEEEQVCAKGAAMYAAVAAQLYPSIEAAQKAYCEPYRASYQPQAEKQPMYEKMYQKYLRLGEEIEIISE